MPADALPVPRAMSTSTGRLVRYYRDALGRPVNGTAHITGASRLEHGNAVQVAADVTAVVADGVLDVQVGDGDYVVTAILQTAEGHVITDVSDPVTVT